MNGDVMNRYKIKGFLLGLSLAVCAGLMVSCIHPVPGDFYTTPQNTMLTPPESTVSTTPQETPTEATTPEQTTPEQTTPEQITTTTTEPPKPEDPPVEKIKIYIDQGHNPFSPTHPPSWNTGASNEALGLYEQEITFEIGMLLFDLLSKDDRFEVRVSRSTSTTILGTDNDSALDYRINDAAAWGADYFISLHTNSYTNTTVRGIEVYTADGDGEGYSLGSEVLKELVKSTGLRNRDMRDGSELRVLKYAKMPAVLVEMGYLSNEDDAVLLRDHPELFAQGVYNGIVAYFDALEEENTLTETETTAE